MKKLSFLILFAFPLLLTAQFDTKKCHSDLVFGFDIGGPFYGYIADRPSFTTDPIYSFRIGTNLNFPVSNRVSLVTGFRLSDRIVKTYDAPLILHEAFTQKIVNDFFAEIPFRARFVFKPTKKQNHFFLEGGLDVNIYIASHVRDDIEKAFGRGDFYNPLALSINVAPGFEIESNQTNISYFIQPIVRVQVTSQTKNFVISDLRFYHIGIETGLRF